MKGILEAAGKSFLRELSEHTFKKATESLVTEGVKAGFEIWKRRRIRTDEYEFAEWKKERAKADKGPDAEKGSKKDDASSGEESAEASPDESSGGDESKS